MSRHVETRQLVAAVEGVALMRGLFAGTDQDARQRLEELRAALARDAGEPVEIPIVEVDEGYARWSTTYDAPGNPLVMLEQPAVWQLLDEAPAGRTIDAACGTGRHAAHLAEQGHELTCVDRTPEMLNRARGNVAGARFVQPTCVIFRSRTRASISPCVRWPSSTSPIYRGRSPSSGGWSGREAGL